MKMSAQQQLTDHLSAMLQTARLSAQTVEVATDCPACNGEGIQQDGTKLVICPACNGQRMIVVKQALL